MKAVISYTSTNSRELESFWKKNNSSTGPRVGSNKIKPESLGGTLEIVDLKSNNILLRKDFAQPLALYKENSGHILCALSSNKIYKLNKKLENVLSITSPLFNSIHSIDKDSQGLLITSSGIDSIVRVFNDASSKVVWSALDLERYSKFPDGVKRTIDYNLDHSGASYPTLQQTTHINSAAIINETYVLSTLFHQGELIKINIKTKEVEVLLKNLRSPHGAHIYTKNKKKLIICSDTLHNRVLVDVPIDTTISKSFRVLEDNFNWVQDAKYYPEEDMIIVLDSNNHRICFYSYNDFTFLNQYDYYPGKRIFDIIVISN